MELTVREKIALRFCISITRQFFKKNNAEVRLFQRLANIPSNEELDDLDLRIHSSIEHDGESKSSDFYPCADENGMVGK